MERLSDLFGCFQLKKNSTGGLTEISRCRSWACRPRCFADENFDWGGSCAGERCGRRTLPPVFELFDFQTARPFRTFLILLGSLGHFAVSASYLPDRSSRTSPPLRRTNRRIFAENAKERKRKTKGFRSCRWPWFRNRSHPAGPEEAQGMQGGKGRPFSRTSRRNPTGGPGLGVGKPTKRTAVRERVRKLRGEGSARSQANPSGTDLPSSSRSGGPSSTSCPQAPLPANRERAIAHRRLRAAFLLSKLFAHR